MSRAQIRRIEKRAIREYKQEIRSNILCVFLTIGFMATMVGGVVYNFTIQRGGVWMFKFLRIKKENEQLRKEINELRIDLAIQISLKKQHEEKSIKYFNELNECKKKIHNIEYALNTEQNEYTAYRKIKNVIFDDQIKR